MKELKILNCNLLALVDDEDFERLLKFRWNKVGTSVRRTYTESYRTYSVALANEVMELNYVTFDHRDRNWLNNQKGNLRECSQSQNNANRPKSSFCTSDYKGVSFHIQIDKWRAYIDKDRKRIHLGCHKTPEEAASAYNKKAVELYGEFALLNKDSNGNIL